MASRLLGPHDTLPCVLLDIGVIHIGCCYLVILYLKPSGYIFYSFVIPEIMAIIYCTKPKHPLISFQDSLHAKRMSSQNYVLILQFNFPH